VDDAYVHAGLEVVRYGVTMILGNPSACFFIVVYHFGHDVYVKFQLLVINITT